MSCLYYCQQSSCSPQSPVALHLLLSILHVIKKVRAVEPLQSPYTMVVLSLQLNFVFGAKIYSSTE